jgi:ketosteroid isomerase-like protein
MPHHFSVVEAYLTLSQALEIDPAAYAPVLHPDVEQTEYPNLLTKTTQVRSFEAILDNVRAGRELLHEPKFTKTTMQAVTPEAVLLETYWHASVMNDFGLLQRGTRISAQMCMVFEFRDGLIFRQRTYRCYEPFAAF